MLFRSVSLLVCIYFGTTGLVPVKYMVAIAVVMVVLLVYQVMSQLTNSSYIFGRVLAVLFCAVFLVGANYVRESMAAFQNVGGATKKVDVISFYVMKDDAAKTLADAKNYSFGILRQQDRENTDKAVQDASKKLNKTLNTVEYDDPLTMVDALYAKEVQAIIMNKSFVDTVKSQYKTFSTDTRELDTSKIESEVEELVDTDVTTKPFNVYISGIDVRKAADFVGKVSGRSSIYPQSVRSKLRCAGAIHRHWSPLKTIQMSKVHNDVIFGGSHDQSNYENPYHFFFGYICMWRCCYYWKR